MNILAVIATSIILVCTPVKAHAQPHHRTINMGEFKITAYCPCDECSEGYGRHTASSTRARSSHTIAVDPTVISYGTKVVIDGQTYVAEDCGCGVVGDHIDIFFDTHEEVEDFGVKYKNVKLIR